MIYLAVWLTQFILGVVLASVIAKPHDRYDEYSIVCLAAVGVWLPLVVWYALWWLAFGWRSRS